MRRYWKWFPTKEERANWERSKKTEIKVCMRFSGKQFNAEMYQDIVDEKGFVTVYRFKEEGE